MGWSAELKVFPKDVSHLEPSVPAVRGRTFPCKYTSKRGKSSSETQDWKNLPDLQSTKGIFSNGTKGSTPHFPSGTSNSILLLPYSPYAILTNSVTFPTVLFCSSTVHLTLFLQQYVYIWIYKSLNLYVYARRDRAYPQWEEAQKAFMCSLVRIPEAFWPHFSSSTSFLYTVQLSVYLEAVNHTSEMRDKHFTFIATLRCCIAFLSLWLLSDAFDLSV